METAIALTEKLKHPLLTTNYTQIFHEEKGNMSFHAPNHFAVATVPKQGDESQQLLCSVKFQQGPIKDFGVNGVANEDLIGMVLCRLESFQDSPYNCRENAIAITKLEEALMWLRKRTMGREQRGVEGTREV